MRFGSSPLGAKNSVVQFIPGAIVVALLLWFLDGFVGVILNLLTLGTGIVPLVMWLAGAYAAGVFVQLFRAKLGGGAQERLEGETAVRLMSAGDSHFSGEFKQGLMARAQKQFGAAASGGELFVLCRDAVAQNGGIARAESLLAAADLYRGLLAVARIGVAVSAVISLKHAVLGLLPTFDIIVPVTGFLDYETLHLVIGVLLLVVFGAGVGLLKRQAEACVEAAVSDVYTGYYTLSSAAGQ
jgi:hypothetical protein